MLKNLGILDMIKSEYKQARQIAGRLRPLRPALSKEIEIFIQQRMCKQRKGC